jgi:hypothetical protein
MSVTRSIVLFSISLLLGTTIPPISSSSLTRRAGCTSRDTSSPTCSHCPPRRTLYEALRSWVYRSRYAPLELSLMPLPRRITGTEKNQPLGILRGMEPSYVPSLPPLQNYIVGSELCATSSSMRNFAKEWKKKGRCCHDHLSPVLALSLARSGGGGFGCVDRFLLRLYDHDVTESIPVLQSQYSGT